MEDYNEYARGYSDGEQGTYNPCNGPTCIELVRHWIADATHDELRTLRAIINGKLSRRTITKDQQDRMQAARKEK